MNSSFKYFKTVAVTFAFFSVVHCGNKSEKPAPPSKDSESQQAPDAPQAPAPAQKTLAETVSEMRMTSTQLKFNGQTVVDLSILGAQTTEHGEFHLGRTLNYLKFNDIEFQIYGEDGAFAAECQYSSLDASFGPGHANCEIANAESFDTLIVCTPTTQGAAIAFAQEWPGENHVFEAGRGMTCWKNGRLMKSKRIFTY